MSSFSLLCLPAELQTLICQALCSHCGEKAVRSSGAAIPSWQDGDEDAAGRRALQALCLTSRHLYAVSLPVLFHQFCLSGDGMHKKAKDNSCALTDPMSPLASARNDSVRRLTSFASVVALAPHLASRVEKIRLDMNVLFRFRHDKDIGLAVTMCSGLFGVRSSGKVLDALRLASEDVRVKADDGKEMGVRALARMFLGLFPRLECLTLHNLYPWWWLWSSQLGHITLVLPPSALSAPASTSSPCAGLSRCLGSEYSVGDGLGDAMVESSGLARVDKARSDMTVQMQPQGSDIHLCSALPVPLSLPRLRRLYVQYGLLDGRALGAILSTCPALETFSYVAGWPKSEEPDLNCAPQQVDHFQLGQACWELGRFAGSSLREVVLDLRQVLMPLAFFGVDEFPDSTRHGFRDDFPGLRSLTLGIESVYAGRYWEPWNSSGQEDTGLVDILPPSIVSLHLLGIVTTRGAEFLPRLISGLRAVAAAKAAGQLPQLERVICADLKPPDLVDKIANGFSECGIHFGP